jgi:uncharacterized membrane protein
MQWILATLIVAAAVHLGTVYALPRIVMARALARMGPANTMHFGTPPTAADRRVVRSSPDLLYSSCPFDLSKGPLRLTARVPHTTYWSVSGFDAATNNFFVRNDTQVAGDSIEIVALRRGMKLPPSDGAPIEAVLFVPTERGVFLVRMAIGNPKDLAALESIQHQAACATVSDSR